jgi:hypothetical protein
VRDAAFQAVPERLKAIEQLHERRSSPRWWPNQAARREIAVVLREKCPFFTPLLWSYVNLGRSVETFLCVIAFSDLRC